MTKGRPNDGRCRRGHDLSPPGAVTVRKDGQRQCTVCSKLGGQKQQHREQNREDHTEAILRLRRSLEHAMPWDRAGLQKRIDELMRSQG